MIKLFIETNYWSSYMILSGAVALLFYYASVLLMSTEIVSAMIQPQIRGVMFAVMISPKALLTIIFVPFIVTLPDVAMLLFSRVMRPTRTDAVM